MSSSSANNGAPFVMLSLLLFVFVSSVQTYLSKEECDQGMRIGVRDNPSKTVKILFKCDDSSVGSTTVGMPIQRFTVVTCYAESKTTKGVDSRIAGVVAVSAGISTKNAVANYCMLCNRNIPPPMLVTLSSATDACNAEMF